MPGGAQNFATRCEERCERFSDDTAACSVTRLCVFASLLNGVAADSRAVGEVRKTVVFKSGEDGYHTYRIPAIVRSRNGDMLAFAEGRKNGPGDHGDIDIVLKRSRDDGRDLGRDATRAGRMGRSSGEVWIGNPSPVVDLMDPRSPGANLADVYAQQRPGVCDVQRRSRSELARAARDYGSAKNRAWDWYATGPVHGIQLGAATTRGD